jgi:hypothetical protein
LLVSVIVYDVVQDISAETQSKEFPGITDARGTEIQFDKPVAWIQSAQLFHDKGRNIGTDEMLHPQLLPLLNDKAGSRANIQHFHP